MKMLIITSGFYWILMRNVKDGTEEIFTLNPSVFCEKKLHIYTHTHTLCTYVVFVKQKLKR